MTVAAEEFIRRFLLMYCRPALLKYVTMAYWPIEPQKQCRLCAGFSVPVNPKPRQRLTGILAGLLVKDLGVDVSQCLPVKKASVQG